jgi:hypothetical protein
MAKSKDKKKQKEPEKTPPYFCTSGFITKSFGVSAVSLHHWVKDGCPKNPDGSYSIPDIYKWKMNGMEKRLHNTSIDTRRKEKDIELKDAHIQKIRGNMIERSLMETVLASRAGNLRRFLMKTFIHGLPLAVMGKTIQEIRTGAFGMVQKAMDVYIGDSPMGNAYAKKE